MVGYRKTIKHPPRSLVGIHNTPKTRPKCATIFIVIMEERPAPLAFNEWLKRRRKACDLTQDELARRAGCSVGALRRSEERRGGSDWSSDVCSSDLERPAPLAFNEWLKRRRKACDLTQDELARRAGCSVGALR